MRGMHTAAECTCAVIARGPLAHLIVLHVNIYDEQYVYFRETQWIRVSVYFFSHPFTVIFVVIMISSSGGCKSIKDSITDATAVDMNIVIFFIILIIPLLLIL